VRNVTSRTGKLEGKSFVGAPLEFLALRSILRRFNREEMQHSLLILDDVPSASFVNALDVGCKILITTDNIDIMNDCRKVYKSVKVI